MPLPHLVLNMVLIAGFFAGGFFLSQRKKARVPLVAAGFIIGILGYWFNTRPDLMTLILPFSDAFFYTNWYPYAVALMVGSAVRLGKTRFQKIRIGVLLAVLFIVSLRPFAFYLKPFPDTGSSHIDENGICRQTSADTCSAAAGVTLLRRYGMEASEEEVAHMALTREGSGTRTLGLFRALSKLAAKSGRGLDVTIERLSVNELLERSGPGIIRTGLSKGQPKNDVEKDLADKYQWTPGVMHDVVYLGEDPEDDNKVLIGEPDFGLEKWWKYELKELFQGYIITLHPREQ